MDNLQFLKDCMGRKLSIRDIEKKYGVTDVLTKYLEVKKMYSQEEIDRIFEEEFYGEVNQDDTSRM